MLKRNCFVLFLFVFAVQLAAQVKLCSWNIQNFGKSKSDSTVNYIAGVLAPYDVVAIVEVVAGNGGAQAVGRLVEELERKGSDWDYCISDPTFSKPGSTERYAFLWKPSRVKKLGEAWLESHYRIEIEREPYMARFSENGKEFTVSAFHAVPKNKQPETEIKYFKFLPALYSDQNILFCGDFNCSESHTVFNPLKEKKYQPIFTCQKTSLKNECAGNNCLASEYDNVFFDGNRVELLGSGVIEFYRDFPSMRHARKISDHLPVWMEFKVK